jgi:hypothetical protein
MSAKIKIETDEPALAALLGMLIAKAVQATGFTNTKVKSVMVESKTEPRTSFDRIDKVLGEYRVDLNGRVVLPPELGEMSWMVAPDDDDFVGAIAKRNPGILDKPVVLDMYADTCKEYERDEKAFLAKE